MRGLILTGCAGFIGLNFLKELCSNKDTLNMYNIIISIDKLGYATEYNNPEYKRLCEENKIVQIDKNINDLSINDDIFNNLKLKEYKLDILDFASESHVDNSINNPSFAFSENSNIPSNLIRWIRDLKTINHYIHISTDEVYGDIEIEEAFDKTKWFTENSPIRPSNPYSASKVAQDMYLHSMWKTFGLNVTLIRMANQFGINQHPEKMLPASISRAINGQPIKIYGNGKNLRQWTWVEDTVKNILFILQTPKLSNNFKIYQISDERNLVDNNTIIQLLSKSLTKYGIPVLKQYIEDRKGHDKAYALISDFNNFDNSLSDNIDALVSWFANNKIGTANYAKKI